MKYSFLALIHLIFLSLSCNNKNDSKNIRNTVIKDQNSSFEKSNILTPYPDFLKNLELDNLTTTRKLERFFSFVNNDIPKYWVGTKWDFNGTTRTPKEGKIACGYFVTNIISDFGMNIRRIFLAQQASSVLIDELCAKGSIQRFNSIDQVKQYLNKRKEKEVFIIGLDFHTGFVIKDDTNNYFLHSNYINQQGVIKEKIEESMALKSSNLFVIGSLTKNKSLFK